MTEKELHKEDIDVVVTWVEGNDPKHIEKRNKYLDKVEEDATSCGTLIWRFVEVNEIRYCLFSLRKFAPWIRNIYLVTDDQCPEWLNSETQEKLGVKIIDHKVIFRDHLDALPSFNIKSINSLLHKIPGLADKFITLNDDSCFVSRVNPEDFVSNGKYILRGKWKKNAPGFFKLLKKWVKHLLVNKTLKNFEIKTESSFVLAANLAGLENKHFELAHSPQPYSKTLLEDFYTKNQKYLAENVKYRFRNKKQTSAVAISTHLILKENQAMIRQADDAILIIPRKGGLKDQRPKFDALKRGHHGKKFLCFQDLVILKQENPEEFQEVIDWLEETIMK